MICLKLKTNNSFDVKWQLLLNKLHIESPDVTDDIDVKSRSDMNKIGK